MHDIKIRDWTISYRRKPYAECSADWEYVHDSYDGPNDDRCGTAPTLLQCLIDITTEHLGEEYNPDAKFQIIVRSDIHNYSQTVLVQLSENAKLCWLSAIEPITQEVLIDSRMSYDKLEQLFRIGNFNGENVYCRASRA